MRTLINASKLEQEQLREAYPDLVNLICHMKPHDYKSVCLSVFDHCLSNEEAIEQLENVLPEEQKKRDASFIRFNETLVNSTTCLKVTLKGLKKDRVLFKKFNNNEAALKHITPTAWPHFIVALPEYEAVYLQSWDDTAVFYYINDNVTKHLKKMALISGLHVFS